jgi:hypothetical protein
MIGGAAGAASGFAVFDVDVKDGVDGYAAMRAADLPTDAPQVETPSGGLHLYFSIPAGESIKSASGGALAKAFGAGLDTRGVCHPAGQYQCRRQSVPMDQPAPLGRLLAKTVKRIAAAPAGPAPWRELNKQAFIMGMAAGAGRVAVEEARAALVEAGLAAQFRIADAPPVPEHLLEYVAKNRPRPQRSGIGSAQQLERFKPTLSAYQSAVWPDDDRLQQSEFGNASGQPVEVA